jgi:hypothetical protein
MGKWHDKIENKIVKELGEEWDVFPSHKRRNYITVNKATRKTTLFNPDIVIKTKDLKKIERIIEVSETSPKRPVEFFGTLLAAEISLLRIIEEKPHFISTNFKLIFIVNDKKRKIRFNQLLEEIQSKSILTFLKDKTVVLYAKNDKDLDFKEITPH